MLLWGAGTWFVPTSDMSDEIPPEIKFESGNYDDRLSIFHDVSRFLLKPSLLGGGLLGKFIIISLCDFPMMPKLKLYHRTWHVLRGYPEAWFTPSCLLHADMISARWSGAALE